MTPTEFEKVVASVLQESGYRVSLTPETNDRGIDVIAEKDSVRCAVQAKYYSEGNRVGSSAVQKVSGLLSRPDINHVAVVTTSSFTTEAEKVASNRGVELLELPTKSTHTHTGQKTHRQGKQAGNSDYIDDSRIGKIKSRTRCSACLEMISADIASHIDHWNNCTLPSDRPSNIPADTWWEIKDRVD